MKKILYSVLSVLLLFLGSACEKDETTYRATANITVINTAAGLGAIRVNPGAGSGFAYAKATDLAYSASAVFGAYTGSNTITVVKSTDTTTKVFQRTIDLKPISTLYIAGTAAAVDTMFRVESNFPYINSSDINAESAMYIRFVNLSPNSGTVNVRISGATALEATALPYKGISEFKKYPAPIVVPPAPAFVTFEIRNAANTHTLASIPVTYSASRYKTASIIFRGLVNTAGTGSDTTFPLAAFQVTYN